MSSNQTIDQDTKWRRICKYLSWSAGAATAMAVEFWNGFNFIRGLAGYVGL